MFTKYDLALLEPVPVVHGIFSLILHDSEKSRTLLNSEIYRNLCGIILWCAFTCFQDPLILSHAIQLQLTAGDVRVVLTSSP